MGLLAGLTAVAAPAIAGEDDPAPTAEPKPKAAKAAGSWHVEDAPAAPEGTRDYEIVESTLSGDVVALKENKAIRCWDGSKWNSITPPPVPETVGRTYAAVGGVSCTDFYIFDYQDTPHRWHWDGAKWTGTATGHKYPAGTLKVSAADDIWAFGSVNTDTQHFDGTAWRDVTMPDIEVHTTVGTSANNFWVLGRKDSNYSEQVAYRWNGSTWSKGTLPAGYEGHMHEGVTVSANELYVFGTNVQDGYLRFDGTKWIAQQVPEGVKGYVHGAAEANGTVWVGLSSEFLRLDAGKWTKEALPKVDDPYGLTIRDLAADPRTDSVIAGGYTGHAEAGPNTPMLLRNYAAG